MRRILFVDDEQNILDGIRRMLRGERHEWEMAFADCAAKALELMASTPFDVVVSDMRMPGMDGAALLERVQQDLPSAVRIVLSGHAELASILRIVPVAHQFLSKPCEADTIRNVITRACNLKELIEDRRLQEMVGTVDTLPVLPRVYHQLESAMTDPDVSLDEVAEIVEQDVGITAKILQLVNSSFFGVPRKIERLRQATSFLGMSMLKNLTLSMEVFRAFESGRLPASFSLEDEQAHATLVARVARHLLPDKPSSEQAFMAGMLHDVGKLVLATRVPQEFEDAVARGWDAPVRSVGQEPSPPVTHGEVGAYLLGLWGMPYPIVEAVANHHSPAHVPAVSFDVLGAVHVANGLARGAADPEAEARLLDLEYLEATGVIDQLPGWRELAAGEVEAAAQAA